MADKQIVEITTEKTTFVGTELLEGQNSGGGLNSTWKGTLNNIASFFFKKNTGWWNIHPSDYLVYRSYTGGSGWVTIDNDNVGIGSSGDVYSPTGITNLWNPSTNQFSFSQLSLGDSFGVRVDIDLISTVNNQEILLRGRWGIGNVEETIQMGHVEQKNSGSGKLSAYTKGPVATDNVRLFPADIQLSSDSSFTYRLRIMYVEVNRR